MNETCLPFCSGVDGRVKWPRELILDKCCHFQVSLYVLREFCKRFLNSMMDHTLNGTENYYRVKWKEFDSG